MTLITRNVDLLRADSVVLVTDDHQIEVLRQALRLTVLAGAKMARGLGEDAIANKLRQLSEEIATADPERIPQLSSVVVSELERLQGAPPDDPEHPPD